MSAVKLIGLKIAKWAAEITHGRNGLELGGSEKSVLFILALHCTKTNVCFPGIDTIARQACIGRRTVSTAIAGLIEKGIIDRDDSRLGKVPFYRLRWTETGAEFAPPTRAEFAPPAETASPAKQAEPMQIPTQTHANSAPEGVLRESTRNRPTPAVAAQRQLALPPVVVGGNPDLPKPAARHRLPATWRPDASDRLYAQERNLDPDTLLEDFRAYFDNARDSVALKSDWPQTWRWWCRNEVKMFGRRNGGQPPKMSQAEHAADVIRRAKAQRDGHGRTIDGKAEPVKSLAYGGGWA